MAGEPILIVDETPLDLKLARDLLVGEGYRVRTASSAEEALEVLRTFQPALVLADAAQTARRITADPAARGITVATLAEAGIAKPIDPRGFAERIRHFLDARAGAPASAARPVTELFSSAEMADLRRK